jgi:hypothetical protein
MARNRPNQAENAPVAQWIEQWFPKPRAHVRFVPGAFPSGRAGVQRRVALRPTTKVLLPSSRP